MVRSSSVRCEPQQIPLSVEKPEWLVPIRRGGTIFNKPVQQIVRRK